MKNKKYISYFIAFVVLTFSFVLNARAFVANVGGTSTFETSMSSQGAIWCGVDEPNVRVDTGTGTVTTPKGIITGYNGNLFYTPNSTAKNGDTDTFKCKFEKKDGRKDVVVTYNAEIILLEAEIINDTYMVTLEEPTYTPTFNGTVTQAAVAQDSTTRSYFIASCASGSTSCTFQVNSNASIPGDGTRGQYVFKFKDDKLSLSENSLSE